jgi:adenylate cyclase
MGEPFTNLTIARSRARGGNLWHAAVVGTGDLRRALVRRVALASLVASATFIGYYQLVGRIPEGYTRARTVGTNAVYAAIGISLLALMTDRRLRRSFEVEWRALLGPEPADVTVRTAVVRQPWRLALSVVVSWSAAIVFAMADDLLRTDYENAVVELVGIGLGTLANASLVYLLAERVLRPLFAPALAPGDIAAATAGIGPRIFVAWALGAALPLAGIVVTPLLHDEGDPFPATVPMVYLACLGLAVGLVMTRLTARSVAEPLESVRSALARVETGDVDVAVAVDDAGEVGHLQSGFNQMVEGLRARQVLEDLFGRHVGADVARRAVERGVSLGGELRPVSVVFVDLIGSTRMAERLPAAEVVDAVNRFLGLVVRAVTDEGGWVNKFAGDGALCVFGAPEPQPDHAARALRAAARLRDELHTAGIDAGIGLASGDAVAGNVGTESRYEYTVMGRPVNEAARLTDLAKQRPARLLVAAVTVRESGAPDWIDAGTVELRGVGTPVAVCEPARARP